MKKFRKALVRAVMAFVLLYAVNSYIMVEWCFAEWATGIRFFHVMISVIVGLFVYDTEFKNAADEVLRKECSED